MTKACWRHIFFILPLIIGIFWSGLAPAQKWIQNKIDAAKNVVTDFSAKNVRKAVDEFAPMLALGGIGGLALEQGLKISLNFSEKMDVVIKAAKGDKEAQKIVQNKVNEGVNDLKRAQDNLEHFGSAGAKIATGWAKKDPVMAAQGVQEFFTTAAQSGQDALKVYHDAIEPLLKGTPIGDGVAGLITLMQKGQEWYFSPEGEELARTLGNDFTMAIYQAMKNTYKSVATGTGAITYDGNCEISEDGQKKMLQDGSDAARRAYDALKNIQQKYADVRTSKICDNVFNVGDVFNGILKFNSDAITGAEQAGGDAGKYLRAMNGEDGNSHLAEHSSIDFGKLSKQAATKVYEAKTSTDKTVKDQLPRYEQCKKKMDELATLRGSNNKDEGSFLYYYHHANQNLTTAAVVSGASLRADAECQCVRDENGKETGEAECMAKNNGELENNMPEGCKPIAAYMQDFSANCIVCRLFATVLGGAQKISENAFTATAAGFIKLLSIGLLLYIGYLTLITIGSPETQKLSKYLTGLLIQGFKVAIAVLILQNPTFLYEKVVTPILDGGLDFGLTLNGMGLAAAKDLGTSYADKFNANSQYLGGDIVQSLTGTVHGFQNAAADIPGMGRSLICNAFQDKVLGVFPHGTLLINGVLLLVFGLFIMLAIGFYIFDCAVELCLVCALMAFFVACWPFKLTSAYTRVGWNMLLNIFFNFVMMGIIVKAINELMSFALGNMGKDELMSILDTGNPTLIDQAFELGGNSIMLVIICSFLCLKMPKETGNLANKFASGAQIQIGAQLATLAASAATAVGVGAIQVFNPVSAGQSAAVAGAVAAHNQMEMLENDAARQIDAAKNAAGMSATGKGKSKGLGRLLSSVAEHTGAKNAISKATNSIQSKLMSAAGKVGIGAGAEMGSKGRDNNANQKDRKAEF